MISKQGGLEMSAKENYDNLRDEIKTGDIILFSGKGTISEAIKFFTRSKWSHLGMVVYIKEWDMNVLWESTTLGDMEDVESGEIKKGVQMTLLRDRVIKYDGEVVLRKLHYTPTRETEEKLRDFRAECKDKPYEKDYVELVKSAYDGWLGKNCEENLTSLFCSEMLAEAYQKMGLLSENKPSNEYTPADFGKDNIDFIDGVYFEENIKIK